MKIELRAAGKYCRPHLCPRLTHPTLHITHYQLVLSLMLLPSLPGNYIHEYKEYYTIMILFTMITSIITMMAIIMLIIRLKRTSISK